MEARSGLDCAGHGAAAGRQSCLVRGLSTSPRMRSQSGAARPRFSGPLSPVAPSCSATVARRRRGVERRRFAGHELPAPADHRVVVALALLGTVLPGGVALAHAEAAAKSWPGFFAWLGRVAEVRYGGETST